MEISKELQRNPHFARYYRTWERNDFSIVFVPLAQICREQGFLETAREICEKGLVRHPTSVSGRLMLARIYMDMDREERAKEIVDKVLEDYPAQQEAVALRQRIGRAYSGKEETVKESLQISPWENATMAKIYADQGEVRIARQILDKILSRDPKNMRASELKGSLGA